MVLHDYQLHDFLNQDVHRLNYQIYLLNVLSLILIFLKIIMETNNNTTEQYNYKPLNNYLVYGYIYPIKFLKAVKLHTIQEYLDFSFILLLLGDDFLPIIPTLTINSLEHILNIYISTKLPIINITDMSINYSNFIILLNNLKHIKYHSHIHKNQLASEILGLRKTKKFLLYSLYNKSSKSKYNLTKSYTFDKIHYLSKGVYVNNNKLELLITNEEKSKSDENIYDKVSNYLEGCKFIFDIYIQNKMENYHWYYKYETAPTLVEISNITSAISFEEVVNMFDYTKTKLDTYLNFTTYQYYIDYLKYVNFKYILEKFNVSNITIDNYNILLEKYCTYKNVPKIFNFDKSKKYINKCFDVLIDKIPTEFLVK